jgi:urease accessory protein
VNGALLSSYFVIFFSIPVHYRWKIAFLRNSQMLRVASITRKPAVKAELVVDTIILDHEARQQKKLTLFGEGGLVAELSLEKAPNLKDGDALKLDNGQLLLVQAAAEKLYKITAENPLRLVRLAWQFGGQHVVIETTAEAIFTIADPALDELIRGQGCSSEVVDRPYQPEQAEHGHDCCHHDHHGHHHDHHHHDHGHHHHDHAHDKEHDHDKEHHHGDDGHCGCGGHHHDK